jgi:hypothetical protein
MIWRKLSSIGTELMSSPSPRPLLHGCRIARSSHSDVSPSSRRCESRHTRTQPMTLVIKLSACGVDVGSSRARQQLPVPRPLIPRQAGRLPTPPRTWFSAPRPHPRQDKRQAESTGRSSIDRLCHREPWRAEQQQRRNIVMRGQVHCEVTGTVSGVGVVRAT